MNRAGYPPVKLNAVMNWELFRKDLERMRDKERKSRSGNKVPLRLSLK